MEQKPQFNVWIFRKDGDYFSERHNHNRRIKTADILGIELVDAVKIPEEDRKTEENLDKILLNSFGKGIEEVRAEIGCMLNQSLQTSEIFSEMPQDVETEIAV